MPDKNLENKDKNAKAVALKYDKENMHAPQVVAKGRGLIADQIIKIAEENDIIIHQDAALTDILSALEIESFIPIEAYAAVAEILSYIYSKDRK